MYPLQRRRQVEREINIHINLSHENIIGLYGAFEDDNNVYLVQELALGGDLYQKANDGTRFNEQTTVQTVITPFLQALKYLHSQVGIRRRN
jgi:aurora kinase